MGVFDKIKGRLGFDDYDGYDDEYEEYEDEVSERSSGDIVVRPRSQRDFDSHDEPHAWAAGGGSHSVRLTGRPGYTSADRDDYDDERESGYVSGVPSRQSRGTITGRGPVMGPGMVAQQSPQVNMHFLEPKSFTEAETLGDRFKRGQPVILNMTGTRPELARRLFDFASGLTFALDGSIQKLADKVFILTPRNVQISDADKRRLREVGLFKDDE